MCEGMSLSSLQLNESECNTLQLSCNTASTEVDGEESRTRQEEGG